MLRKLITLRKYKNYEFACLSGKNFIISQILNFFSNVFWTFVILVVTVFGISYIYPLVSAHIAG